MSTAALPAIRRFRQKKQSDVAREIGRSQTWLSFVEAGKLIPQRPEAEKIAKVLDVDLCVLFPDLVGTLAGTAKRREPGDELPLCLMPSTESS